MGSIPSWASARPTGVKVPFATGPPASGVWKEGLPRSVSSEQGSPCAAMVSASPRKLEAVPCSSTRPAESIALVASSRVITRSSGPWPTSQACGDPS